VSREFSFVSLPYDKKVKPYSGTPVAARCDNSSGRAGDPGAEHDHAPMKIDPDRTGGRIAHINITRCKSGKNND
jgi:hypothetical protein